MSEKESLIKGFLLFFVVMELFLAFIFYHYYRLEEEHLSEQLFLEMKNYSFFLEDERFDIDIVPKATHYRLYELYFDKDRLYILTPLADSQTDLLKVFYPREDYEARLNAIAEEIWLQFFWLSLISIVISLLFALYALHPLRSALLLLEEFIKDIIHDLNTPISSILINLKMIDPSEESERIAQSAKTISMLHKNLDSYLKQNHLDREPLRLDELVQEQIDFFASMYDYLEWQVELEATRIISNANGVSRMVYNLLSNACKYNTTDGFISVTLQNKTLVIRNDSYGINNPQKVFNRFYKESERGLGIGLHIVKKLADELEIEKHLEIEETTITVLLSFK